MASVNQKTHQVQSKSSWGVCQASATKRLSSLHRKSRQPVGHHERVDRQRPLVHRDRGEAGDRRPQPEEHRPDFERVPEQHLTQWNVGAGLALAQEDVPVADP